VKVAIVVQNGSVSPRFDRAPQLLVIETNGADTACVDTFDITIWPAHGRATRLAWLGMDMVVCGGVSSFDEAGFDDSEVQLIKGVSGPANLVIEAVHRRTIVSGQSFWGHKAGQDPA
jgi:predicted Fe-Mo cluster-binding NifX family protein